ncbi:DUF2555 domain-containing protein [Candidatus Cyanaurora vandensis]|nr:DUF2555 domain-containing protein [Candidatus Cyanaurora vandensis]
MPLTSAKPLTDWTEQDAALLAERLERDEYTEIETALADWKLLKALQYSRPELVLPYSHLLELEPDED